MNTKEFLQNYSAAERRVTDRMRTIRQLRLIADDCSPHYGPVVGGSHNPRSRIDIWDKLADEEMLLRRDSAELLRIRNAITDGCEKIDEKQAHVIISIYLLHVPVTTLMKEMNYSKSGIHTLKDRGLIALDSVLKLA